MKAYLTICLLNVFSFEAFSQNHVADSLQSLLETVRDTSRVNVLVALGGELLHSAPRETESYAKAALAISNDLKFSKGTFKACKLIGDSFVSRSEYATALAWFQQAREALVLNNIWDQSLHSSLYNSSGIAYYRIGNYKDALENFLRSLEIEESRKNRDRVCRLQNNIGMIYLDQGEYDYAFQYFTRSFKQAQTLSLTGMEGIVANNIGLVYRHRKDYPEAIRYFLMAVEKKTASNNTLGAGSALANLAEVYKRMKDYPMALDYLRRAEEIKRKAEDKSGLIMVRDIRAEIFIAQGKIKQAEEIIVQNLKDLKEVGGENTPFVYQRYHDLEVARNNYDEALNWYIRKAAYNDSLYNEEKRRQLGELQTLYEVNKKEKELIRLEKDKEAASLANIMMIVLLVGSLLMTVMLGIYLYLRWKSRKLRYQTERELNLKKLENARIREGELTKEIDFKNRELASYTINFIQKSELLAELKNELQSVRPGNPDDAKKIAGIRQTIESSFDVERGWEDFRTQFENVHQNFFSMLKERCPELTEGDLKLCALLKLNMNLKESARILAVSPESVKTARYRLRKKLKLSQGDKLMDFIFNVEHETADQELNT